jgi:hypothetical protein
MSADVAPRFGIGEWYGHSFVRLSPEERAEFAKYRPDKSKRLKAAEKDRLAFLREKQSSGVMLPRHEADRLRDLIAKEAEALSTNQICRFRGATAICTKDGGVCSLRLYGKSETGQAYPITGDRGNLRILCPQRFHEENIVFKWIGRELLKDEDAILVKEVGFLESSSTVDSEEGADVGRIDMILVKGNSFENYPIRWCAVEIQAVYFSGKEMSLEFRNIEQFKGQISFPTENRRPDYRSSGPKRLMPQLQIKVPTLRRWGQKMAVVVDEDFFNSMGSIREASDISNSDVAWFVVGVDFDEQSQRYVLVERKIVYSTLESSVEGLTGGDPVDQAEFERRIYGKLPSRMRDKNLHSQDGLPLE